MRRLAAIALALTLALPLACSSGAPAKLQETPLSSAATKAATLTASAAGDSASATAEVTAPAEAPSPTAPAGEPSPTAEAAQDPALLACARGFAGTWDTNWGTMTLTVTGSTVAGAYEYNDGRIEAELSSDGCIMEGTWSGAPTYAPPDDAGRVTFTLSDDSSSLEGYWWYGEDEDGGEWAGTRARPAAQEPGPGAAGEPGLTLSSNPANDLLFYVTKEGGGRVYYYGTEAEGAMRLSHIVVDDGAGSQDVVIYDARLLPVQWILSQATVAVYPAEGDDEGEAEEGDESWFDPHQALHVIVEGEEETSLAADIVPGDLGSVLDELEQATGQEFPGARAFLAEHDVTWEELVALAQEGGEDQPLYIAAATGFGAGAAALSLSRAGGETAALPRVPGLAAPQAVIFGQVIKVGAAAAGDILADWLGEGLDPGDGPAVSVLLCRGAAKYGVCHYMFFHRDRLGDCITLCQTSLGCFTDICMPMDISAELAMSIGAAF